MNKCIVFVLGALLACLVFGCSRGSGAGVTALNDPTKTPTTTGAEIGPETSSSEAAPQLSADGDPIAVGTAAPDFTVQVDGKPMKLSELKGHPVMLDFWATWCGPCVAGLPHTQAVYDKGKDAGLQVIAISDETSEITSKFIKDKNYSFSVGLDPDRDAFTAYKVESIPTTVVIDKNGKVVTYLVGSGQDDELNDALARVGIRV